MLKGIHAYLNSRPDKDWNTCGQAAVATLVDFYGRDPWRLPRDTAGHWNDGDAIDRVIADGYGPNMIFGWGTHGQRIADALTHYGIRTTRRGFLPDGGWDLAWPQLRSWLDQDRPVPVLLDLGRMGGADFTFHWAIAYAYTDTDVRIASPNRDLSFQQFQDAWRCDFVFIPLDMKFHSVHPLEHSPAAPHVLPGNWSKTDGSAYDVGVGADGTVFVIGTNPTPGGFGIHRWTGAGWQGIDGGAVRLAVDPAGLPWVVNDKREIYQRLGNGAWQRQPGSAYDVGVGADGTVFVIGTNPTPGGFGIHRWTGAGWQGIDGGAVRIAVDPAGLPWVVNDKREIYQRLDNGAWQRQPGSATDIGVGADGTVLIAGTDLELGGFGIHRWNGASWDEVGGSAVAISVDPHGSPWVVNSGKEIFRRV